MRLGLTWTFPISYFYCVLTNVNNSFLPPNRTTSLFIYPFLHTNLTIQDPKTARLDWQIVISQNEGWQFTCSVSPSCSWWKSVSRFGLVDIPKPIQPKSCGEFRRKNLNWSVCRSCAILTQREHCPKSYNIHFYCCLYHWTSAKSQKKAEKMMAALTNTNVSHYFFHPRSLIYQIAKQWRRKEVSLARKF